MSLPTVDIVIAGRNEARHLGACLDALRVQNYPAELLRIFVVDNNSRDETASIAREKGVVVLQQSVPGAAAARNLAIASGQGELIGFLDAHCIVNRDWVRVLAAVFADEKVGGAQARIDSRADDARVRQFLAQTDFLSNEQILDDTIRGKKNLYPWLLAGNSMFRRQAVNEAGGFNEGLNSCEDVEISWRVFLLGYQFRYVENAVAVHFDGSSWRGFLRKGRTYARGAVDLAHLYSAHGANSKFAPAPLWTQNVTRSLMSWHYRVGYLAKNARLRLGLERVSRRAAVAVLPRFRSWFTWQNGQEIQIAPQTYFWFRGDTESASATVVSPAVVVHIPTRQRAVIEAVGALVWRGLADEKSRDEIAAMLATNYQIAPTTALHDIDDFVEELIGAQMLRVRRADSRDNES